MATPVGTPEQPTLNRGAIVLLIVLRRGHWGELLGGPDEAATPSSS